MICDFPQAKLSYLFGKPSNSLDFISKSPYRFLTENARTALFQGIKLLGRHGNGRNEIVVPAYNCGTEVEAIVRSGYKPVFYKIDLVCRPDIDDMEKKIGPQTFAVLVTHFNGFPQPIEEIKDLCLRNNILLIEDCAHVLKTEISYGCLGTFGDAAIFSLGKFLPIRKGGLLIINRDEFVRENGIDMRGKSELADDLIFLLKKLIRNNFMPGSQVKEQKQKPIGPCSKEEIVEIFDFTENHYDQGIPLLSRFLVERFDLNEIVMIRRRNYTHLHEGLNGAKVLRSLSGRLPQGVCPWFYLAEVPDPWKLKEYLGFKAIESIVFWSYFHKDFPFEHYPESTYLKNHVIALPIHQDLPLSDMDYISEKVKEYFEQ